MADFWRGEDLDHVIYRSTVMKGNLGDRRSNTLDLFRQTQNLHNDVIHFMIKNFGDEVSITLPAVLGAEKVADIAGKFIRAGLDATRSSTLPPSPSNLDWPEYVLWPNHFYEECHAPILDLN